MNIDSLQIKRILTEAAWNDHKNNYILKSGELMWVSPDAYKFNVGEGIDDPKVDKGFILVGNGKDNLETLLATDGDENGYVFVPLITMEDMSASVMDNINNNIIAPTGGYSDETLTTDALSYRNPKTDAEIADKINITVEITDDKGEKKEKTLSFSRHYRRNSNGASDKVARADHTHSFSREQVWDALDVNTHPTGLLTCRRIIFGQGEPSKNETVKALLAMTNMKKGNMTDQEWDNAKNSGLHAGDIYIQF